MCNRRSGLAASRRPSKTVRTKSPAKEDISRITLIAGRLSVTDFFDNNAYAHDGRTQFFNWNIDCCGAYDWTMDQISYTWGAMAELNQKFWAFRAGYFLVPVVSNADDFDTNFPDGEYIGELELRYSLFSEPGKLRLMAWANRANMGSYAAALAEPITTPNYPDITLVRQVRTNYGFIANLEQAITDDLGVFSRASLEPRSRRNHRLDRLRRKPFRRRRAEGDILGTPERQNRRGRRHRGPLARGAGLFRRRRARNIDRRRRAQLPAGEDHRDLLLLQPQCVVELLPSIISLSPTPPTTPTGDRSIFLPGGFTPRFERPLLVDGDVAVATRLAISGNRRRCVVVRRARLRSGDANITRVPP